MKAIKPVPLGEGKYAERIYIHPVTGGFQVRLEYAVIRPEKVNELCSAGGGCPSKGKVFTDYDKAVAFAEKYVLHLKTYQPTEVILDLENKYRLIFGRQVWPGVEPWPEDREEWIKHYKEESNRLHVLEILRKAELENRS